MDKYMYKEVTGDGVNWDIKALRANLKAIQETLANHADEFNASRGMRTIMRSYESPGAYVLLESKQHGRGTICDAFVQIGDNSYHDDTIIIPEFTKAVNIKATEKSGKVHIFTLTRKHVHYVDRLMLQKKGSRRVLVGITLEEINNE